jgi:hypothetical protein
VGPYRNGQTGLLVVDVTNVGGRALRGVSIGNQASNLDINPSWGGCETAPCPPFTLARLRQKQITIPVTVTDARQPIFDVVTVSGDGVTRQAVLRIPPPPPPRLNLLPYILGAAAALIAGVAAWRLWPHPTPNWPALITARGALGAAQEVKLGDVTFAVPPVSVRAHMDPADTRFGGPIPLNPPPGSEAPQDQPPGRSS